MAEVTHEIETWTPSQAGAALSKNMVNRPLRKDTVDKYYRDMLSEKYNTYTAPIMFDSDGKLIDGQHRLTAQVQADVKLKWLVVRGVPPETQTNMDIGATRSLADILHFQGEARPGLLVAITRLVHAINDNKLSRGRYSSSVEEVLQTLEDHPELRWCTEVAAWFNTKKTILLPPSVVGAAHWMIAEVNGIHEADAFVHRMGLCSGEPEGSPVLALMRRANEIWRASKRVNSRDKLNLVLKTWNKDAKNKTAHKLSLQSRTGEFKLVEVLERDVPLEEPDDDD